MQLNMFRASSCPSSGVTTTAVAASGLPSELGDSSAVGHSRADHNQHHCYHQAPTVNQRLLLQLLYLLMMGMRLPETCWALFKRQVINLRRCCIWLVDSVESMMMHGLANPKFENWQLALPCLSVHPSVRVEHLASYWMAFNDIS